MWKQVLRSDESGYTSLILRVCGMCWHVHFRIGNNDRNIWENKGTHCKMCENAKTVRVHYYSDLFLFQMLNMTKTVKKKIKKIAGFRWPWPFRLKSNRLQWANMQTMLKFQVDKMEIDDFVSLTFDLLNSKQSASRVLWWLNNSVTQNANPVQISS